MPKAKRPVKRKAAPKDNNSFADLAGRKWSFNVNGLTFAKVAAELNIDLRSVLSTGMAVPPLVKVMGLMLEDQLAAKKVDEHSFLRAFDESTFVDAGRALSYATAEFMGERGELYRRLLDRSGLKVATEAVVAREALKQLTDEQIDEALASSSSLKV